MGTWAIHIRGYDEALIETVNEEGLAIETEIAEALGPLFSALPGTWDTRTDLNTVIATSQDGSLTKKVVVYYERGHGWTVQCQVERASGLAPNAGPIAASILGLGVVCSSAAAFYVQHWFPLLTNVLFAAAAGGVWTLASAQPTHAAHDHHLCALVDRALQHVPGVTVHDGMATLA